MAELNTDVRFVRGVGEARAKSLAKLGITDLKSLISYFPRAYEDRRESRRIAELQVGERACVTAMVASEPKLSRIRKGLELVKLRVVDESAALELTYFNQSYLKNTFRVGGSYTFYGTVEGTLLRRTMTNPVFEREGLHAVTGCIVPVYPLTAGVGQSLLHRAIRQGLDEGADRLPDLLPAELRRQHGLCDVRYAYENIHFPTDDAALAAARRRLAFEELYFLTLGLRLLRARRTTVKGKTCAAVDMTPFFGALPFSLTGAQARAVDDILRDMTAERPMNRLVQGDVGSGKTMVAAAGIYFAAKNGLQAALMAPTEILAEQHEKTLSALLGPLGVHVLLLTGAKTPAQKRAAREKIASGEAQLIVGTHALISTGVEFHALGLVVADEQHRFGVAQRTRLTEKGDAPHLLVMSATPIPRTLALIAYGDLDVSVIAELPPGRRPVETFLVSEALRERLNGFIRKQCAGGHQVYVVCPAVEDGEENTMKSAEGWAQTLRDETFPELRVGLVHGRMKSAEKDAALSAFRAGDYDILVATTVVEVGVDVPNATLMVIENAERFGLSQLHQLRGRVGRGSAQSYCVLVSGTKNEETKKRLQALCKTTDGFKIAEQDLALRGPGDFFGSRQHGLPLLKVASLQMDLETLRDAQQAAAAVIQTADSLNAPELAPLKARVEALFTRQEVSLNLSLIHI